MNTPNHRQFLRGLGVSLALPVFETFAAKKTSVPAGAQRFVCVSPNYGMYPGGFFPEQAGAGYVMPPLLKAARGTPQAPRAPQASADDPRPVLQLVKSEPQNAPATASRSNRLLMP